MQGVAANLTIDTGACEIIVSHWLFERMSEDQALTAEGRSQKSAGR